MTPKNVILKNNLKLGKDLGLHLKRLGFDEFKSLVFPNIPITNIGQLDNEMFTISIGTTEMEGSKYVVTFDFGLNILQQLIRKIPDEAIKKMLIRNNESRTALRFSDRVYYINIDCIVGKKLEENKNEIFLPLTINSILD